MKMEIEGTLERLLASVLPHEVTHTVFAHHFRQPVPRWADEGGSVLSEDDMERQPPRPARPADPQHARPGHPAARACSRLKEYPRDVMVLYAEGYSVTNFLVGKSSRPAFLNFVADGMRDGWDQAVQTHYGYRNVEELEQAWLQHLRDAPAGARRDDRWRRPTRPEKAATPREPRVVRQTLPPATPVLVGAPRSRRAGHAARRTNPPHEPA